jgi:hypothetical protein
MQLQRRILTVHEYPERTVRLDDLTPEEAAAIFAAGDDHFQAAFLNRVGAISRSWPSAGWCVQACSLMDKLDDDGRMMVEKLADHYASRYDWKPSE